MRNLRSLHKGSAVIVGTFLAVHILNHLVGVAGQEVHTAYMGIARRVYRHPLVEPILLGLIVWQVASGSALLARRWRLAKSAVDRLQVWSGAYLALFLLNHVGAVLYGRHALGLDTDFRFAAAGFFVPPWGWFFAPYYGLAMAAVFTHLGCAISMNHASAFNAARRSAIVSASLVVGVLAAMFIVMSLMGALYPVDIPPAYRATYGRQAKLHRDDNHIGVRSFILSGAPIFCV